MLGQEEEVVVALLGRPLATAKPRHHADRALSFLTEAMRVEVGFRQKKSLYAIFRKRSGSKFQPIEVQSILYSIGRAADWEMQEQGGPLPPASRRRSTERKRESAPVDFVYKERKTRTAPIQRILFAQLHALETQLAVFLPDWLPDLTAVASNPLR